MRQFEQFWSVYSLLCESVRGCSVLVLVQCSVDVSVFTLQCLADCGPASMIWLAHVHSPNPELSSRFVRANMMVTCSMDVKLRSTAVRGTDLPL